MLIRDYKKLEDSINNQDFNKSYKTINIVMFALSIFGHFASIFLAYFMLSKILSAAMTDNPIVVFVASIIILTGIELLKRDIFEKFSFQYLKVKSFGKDVMPLLLLSIIIISISFYSSISGAKEFSSKSAILEDSKKEIIQHYKDSVSNVYNLKIEGVNNDIKVNKSKLESKDKEQTELESVQPLSYQQRNRVRDLKEEKRILREENVKFEGSISDLNIELSNTIKSKEEELTKDTDSKKEDNSKNSSLFIIISTLIELTILAGVYFNKYYKFRSYKEFRDKIERDPNYQKWVTYESILDVIYGKDSKVNDKLPSNKNIVEMCKLNDVIILQRDMNDFIKLMTNLNVIKSSGSARYIAKQRDLAFDILKSHFNIN
jgi:hypothetical protein